MITSYHRLCADAPEDYGLLISFVCGTCLMEFVPDKHLERIHPNAYGPASLTKLSCLTGGGSGVRVFRGFHPQLGSLVMKHGGHNDTEELFALATIAQELKRRNSPEAAKDMQSRIPEFRMIYISPEHLRDIPKEVWKLLSMTFHAFMYHGHVSEIVSLPSVASEGSLAERSIASNHSGRHLNRKIQLFASSIQDKVEIEADRRHLEMVLGSVKLVKEEWDNALCYGTPGDSYPCFKRFVHEVILTQKKRVMKFTLGQKAIGGPSAKTGSSYLAKGELHGELLETLIREYLHVIRNLQQLTLPQEQDRGKRVRKEVAKIEKNGQVYISDEADAFVGFAVKKNYYPDMGRFFLLRRMGHDFRFHGLILTKEEKLPARLLGIILQTGAMMSDVFEYAPNIPTALDIMSPRASRGQRDAWRVLLRDAVSLKCSAARKCIWSCGIADGGLHNLFLSSDRIWFFDLGEPTLQPLPAFVTKFLFSFFHSLGMVDDEVNGGWVNCFMPGKKLKLTRETEMLISKAYDAFKVTVDRLIEVLFDGEEEVRGLLMNYVTLQLLSDAAFCLNRWTIKGGGRSRNSNHNKNLEIWLWRALWNIYIASDLCTTKRLSQLCGPIYCY
jgi:hypothetical protein